MEMFRVCACVCVHVRVLVRVCVICLTSMSLLFLFSTNTFPQIFSLPQIFSSGARDHFSLLTFTISKFGC